MIKSPSLSKSFSPIFLLLLLQSIMLPSAAAVCRRRHLVRETCARAAQSNPAISYDFCVTSLQASPRSAAADLQGLGVISASLAAANATSTGKRIEALLARGPDPYDAARLRDCRELYSDAAATLEEAARAIEGRSYFDANFKLGSGLDAAVTCEEGWAEEPGHASPLTMENRDLGGLCRIGLAITNFLRA